MYVKSSSLAQERCKGKARSQQGKIKDKEAVKEAEERKSRNNEGKRRKRSRRSRMAPFPH